MPREISHFAQKLNNFILLSEDELECLADLQTTPIHVQRGSELVHQGDTKQAAYILQAGWGCSSKLLPDGGRQIITFPLPGDCIGLRSVLLRTSDHSFSAVTDAIVTRVEVSRILRVFADYPYIGAAVLWAASRDEALIVEHLASVGRRNAVERTAHFFLELHDRLRLAGLASSGEFDCPLTQYLLADALGLSAIHVNRVLRELRERGLLTFQDRKATIHDHVALRQLSGYEALEEGPLMARGMEPQGTGR